MQAFTDHYYSTFDTNRAALGALYQEQSLLSFEGQKFQGTQQVSTVGVVGALPVRGGAGLAGVCVGREGGWGGGPKAGDSTDSRGARQSKYGQLLLGALGTVNPCAACFKQSWQQRTPQAAPMQATEHPSNPATRATPPRLQILQKLTSLPFQQCKHHVSSIDAQPSVGGGLIVFVTGQLLVRGQGRAGAASAAGALGQRSVQYAH